MPPASKERKLYNAAMADDRSQVRKLLSEGADPNFKFSREYRIGCIQVAAKCGSAQALEELLSDPRADARYADLMWNTALIYASDPDKGMPGLPEHIRKGHVDCVKMLAPLSDLEHTQRWGRTALHCAANADSPEMCAELLKAGARLDPVDCQGNSPLSLAARGNRALAVRFLLPLHAQGESRRWIALAAKNALGSGYGELAAEIEGFERALVEQGEIGERIPASAGAKKFRI